MKASIFLSILELINDRPQTNQFNLRDSLIRALETVYAKIIAILTFIYLIVQFLAIMGILPKPYGLVPLEYRSQVFFGTIVLIFAFVYYYIYIRVYKLIAFLSNQIRHFTNENEDLKKQLEEKKKPKKPMYLIDDHLGYADVKFAIYCLSKKIEDHRFFERDANGLYDSKKNIIIGIDRGGAIVGGMLAKNLGLAIKTMAINYSNKQPKANKDASTSKITSIIYGKCLDNIDFNNVTRILLVDDAIRTGDAMEEAKELLKSLLTKANISFYFDRHDDQIHSRNNNIGHLIQIEIACILYQQENNPSIGLPKFHIYQTDRTRTWLLWDTTREKMKIDGKEKELFDEYYKLLPKDLIKRIDQE